MLFYYLLVGKTMKKLFLLIAIVAIVTSCSKTSEQTKSEEDLELFLEKIEKDNLYKLYKAGMIEIKQPE